MSSTIFVVTDYGLAAAANAANTGIKIELTTFKVGSGYGYTPLSTMTSLQGATLYTDNITSYSNTPDGALLMVCQLSPQAGTFQFGEIGIYDSLGNLFALAALSQLQTKYSGLGSNVNSSVQFNCLMKLAQGTAIFSLPSTNQTAEIEYVSAWNLVTAPSVSSFPDASLMIVTELDSNGLQSILIKEAGDTWSVSSPWDPAFMGISLNTSTLSTLTFTLPSQFTTLENVAGTVSGSWLVESGNTFRMGSMTIISNVATITFTEYLTTPYSGSVNIYTNTYDILERSLREQAITVVTNSINSLATTVDIGLNNRVRVDTATQGLTPTQILNAQTNLGLNPGANVVFNNLLLAGSQVLDAANFNTYAPTLTGVGSSGTWPISITGNSLSATNISGGVGNNIPVQSGANSTTFISAPSVNNTFLNWNGTNFNWKSVPVPTVIFDGSIPYNSTTSFTVDPTRLTVFFINEGNGFGGNSGLYLGVSWGPGSLANTLYFFNSGVDYQVTFAGALMKSMPAGNGSILQIQPFGNFIGGYGAPTSAECLVMQF